ncbi:hypothetical protein SHKM778_85140 [Streptomyces sp. KM77-8]|uniref:LytR family transcriptional regulator n=1 Tax=Streptomyces haneummycinicus TaxID=3074435 RepID=A0AAT9HXY5_9ACTN
MRTVTELTGITPDNFIVADFNAVKTLTSAVGGVDVCLAKDIDDPDSHLKLSEGTHTIEGEEALAFVRTRHSVGFGGDLSRIELQQQFLSSLMRKLKSNDTLTSPTKMIKLAEAGTKALTVDSQLDSINKLKDLGLELGKLNVKNLTFATVPVKDNPAEEKPVTVVLKEESARQVFDMVKNDVSFTEVKQQKKKEKAAVAARLKGEQAPASEVRVQILNGGAQSGSAQETLKWLQVDQGVEKSENAGNAPEVLSKTTLEYAPDQAAQARRLAGILGLSGSAMKPGESVTNSQGVPAMTLTLGKDFKGPASRSRRRRRHPTTSTSPRRTRSSAPSDLTGLFRVLQDAGQARRVARGETVTVTRSGVQEEPGPGLPDGGPQPRTAPTARRRRDGVRPAAGAGACCAGRRRPWPS